ncbi:MAG: hypothetical protein PHD02_03515 [Bacilli bacterium]|nr:hypothetical protein [Bacilli bacterium]
MKKIIFFSGIHGVGKDYILEKIQSQLNINSYTASDIIKNSLGKSDENKITTNIDQNQMALIYGLETINESLIVSNGHLC